MINLDKRISKEDILIEIEGFIREGIIFRKDGSFVLDFQKLSEDNPEMSLQFISNPIDFINAIKFNLKGYFEDANLRIINYENEEDISNFRVSHIGKLYKVSGMISRVNKVIALTKESRYECANCGSVIRILDSSRRPSGCTCGNTNAKKFKLIERIYRDVQEIEIEESQDKVIERQPQKIRIRLYDELTDADFKNSLQAGNKIEVLGIVEEIPINTKKVEEDLYEYRLVALDILNDSDTPQNESITDEDLKQIQEIASDKPLETMAKSLSPEIIGNLNVKKTLVLQQVGGVKKQLSDGKLTRDKIHILLIGDAGVSKTQLGKSVHMRTPRAYYTSGEQTSAAGLTSTVIRDELTGTWSLLAGAMPKANGSLLIVDEIDKTGEQTLKSLHTPLESGIIPVNKAGINTTLNADCSLLAIANPKGGRFETDTKITIVKQIHMPPTLLSRFDIIHVMKDSIDESKDREIIESIFINNEKKVIIPVDLYRKYIAYARKLKPVLNKDGMEELKKFYTRVRKQSVNPDSTMVGMPITPRHAQGIIRMAEANAKLRLSETVEIEDFKLAEDLFYESLLKIGMDEEGNIDIARMSSGITLSRKKKISLYYNALKEMFEGKTVLSDTQIREELFKRNINVLDFNDIMDDLNRDGYILKSSDGWKLN